MAHVETSSCPEIDSLSSNASCLGCKCSSAVRVSIKSADAPYRRRAVVWSLKIAGIAFRKRYAAALLYHKARRVYCCSPSVGKPSQLRRQQREYPMRLDTPLPGYYSILYLAKKRATLVSRLTH